MPDGDIETFQVNGEWYNRVEGQGGLLGSFEVQDDAVAAGRRIARARKVQHIIRRLDGTIGERNSYEPDPQTLLG